MQTRNLQYNAHGTVDMEINHPTLGWIPFTASPNDTEQLGKDLYAEAIAGTLGAIAAYVAPILSSADQRAAIQSQIDTLERTEIMPRVTREALIALAVQEATTAGITEPQLYAANIGYHKTKDADTAIAALRAQMAAIL